jgi:hypothetical protein
MWPVLIVVGLGALFAACSSSDDPQSNSKINDDLDAGVDADAGVDLDASIDAGQDADVDSGADAGDDGGTIPPTPNPPEASLYSDAPCSFPASMSFDANSDTFLLSCGGAQNGLFRSPPLNTSGDWTLIGPSNGYPSNHIQIDNRYYAVAHAMPDGLTIIDSQDGSISGSVDLSTLVPLDQSNQPVGFTLNTPAGMAQIGGKLLIAASNLDQVDYQDPANTTFHPGTVLYMNYNGDGTVDESSARVIFTSRVNPTGLVAIDANDFAVLSSGDYKPSQDNAALDRCSVQTLTCNPTLLGSITGQTSPAMPITEGGLILIGAQKPFAKIFGIDKSTGVMSIDRDMPDVQNFISNIGAYGDVAIMSDFGIFGQGGSILYAHTGPNGWLGIPITPMSQGSLGPAVVVGDKLYQTMTDNNGMNGSIWEINLNAMD